MDRIAYEMQMAKNHAKNTIGTSNNHELTTKGFGNYRRPLVTRGSEERSAAAAANSPCDECGGG